MGTFVLAMVQNPDVQKKAQAELDSVIGKNQLPKFEDKDSLPYIQAIMKECFRWKNVLPVSQPHSLTADDEYRGYTLRKGTICIPNTWFVYCEVSTRFLIPSPIGLFFTTRNIIQTPLHSIPSDF